MLDGESVVGKVVDDRLRLLVLRVAGQGVSPGGNDETGVLALTDVLLVGVGLTDADLPDLDSGMCAPGPAASPGGGM